MKAARTPTGCPNYRDVVVLSGRRSGSVGGGPRDTSCPSPGYRSGDDTSIDIRDILSSGVSRPMTSRPREEGVDTPPSSVVTSSYRGRKSRPPVVFPRVADREGVTPVSLGALFRNPTLSSEGGAGQEATLVNRCSLKVGARRRPPVTVIPFQAFIRPKGCSRRILLTTRFQRHAFVTPLNVLTRPFSSDFQRPSGYPASGDGEGCLPCED